MTDLEAEIEASRRAELQLRLAELRRMQRIATGLLLLMLAAYVACTLLERSAPWMAYPAAFAGAATAGACADWFAVTALFRHPFGLPIPYTAILPRNQQRLAESVGVFVASHFLSPAEIAPRLERLDLAGWMARWLKEPRNVDLVIDCSRSLLTPAVELAGDMELRQFGSRLIHEGLDSIAAAPLAARALRSLIERGHHWRLYDSGVDLTARFLRDNRALLRQKATEGRSGWLTGWVDSKAADAFIIALQEALSEAHAADHPWREAFETFLERLIHRLSTDADLYARCEQVKADVLGADLVDGYLLWLSGEAEARLRTELDSGGDLIEGALKRLVGAVSNWLDDDERIGGMINRWAREVVLGAVVPNRNEIGAFVTDVIARWDVDTLVERLEGRIGTDLQYIRINGALFGGLVGLVLFTVAKLVGSL